MMEFATYIQRNRVSKNLKKSELARRCGITPQYVADIENGRIIPSEDKIQKLIEVLELDEFTAYKLADRLPSHVVERVKREYFNRGE